MLDFRNVRWTVAAVILLVVCVQWTLSRAVYTGRGEDSNHYYNRGLADRFHKHVNSLKAPDPLVVETVKKRIKADLKGRKADQSNERNMWRSHPKNEHWSGPDTQEVTKIFTGLGI